MGRNNDNNRQTTPAKSTSTNKNTTAQTSRTTQTPVQPSQTTQTARTEPTVPAQSVAEKTASEAEVAPAPAPAVVAPIVEQEATPVPPADTAAEVAVTAAAQAESGVTAVTYSSQQISTETRNRLIAIATSALVSGSLIFIMSFFGTGSLSPRQMIPARYAGRQGVSLS